MKKSILSLILFSLLLTTLPTNKTYAVSNGTKVAIGVGGAAAGTALGIYLHRLAKKQSEQLGLLELFKKYTSQDNFKGLADTQAKVEELANELERLELWDAAQQADLDNISSLAILGEKITGLTKKWWLYTILEALCFGGAAIGGGVALKGMYDWATTKPTPQPNPVVNTPTPQPNPVVTPQPVPQPNPVTKNDGLKKLTLDELQARKKELEREKLELNKKKHEKTKNHQKPPKQQRWITVSKKRKKGGRKKRK